MCAGNRIDCCQNECCHKNRVQEVNWSRVVHAFLQCLGPWIDEHCLMISVFLNQRIVSVTVKSQTCLYLKLEPCQSHDPSSWLLGKRGSWGCRISMSRETRVPFEKILPPTLPLTKAVSWKVLWASGRSYIDHAHSVENSILTDRLSAVAMWRSKLHYILQT